MPRVHWTVWRVFGRQKLLNSFWAKLIYLVFSKSNNALCLVLSTVLFSDRPRITRCLRWLNFAWAFMDSHSWLWRHDCQRCFWNRLDCRIPGNKMANLKHCYRGATVVYLKHCYCGAAVVFSRCARSPVIVKPGHKIAILKHCYRRIAVV